MSENAPENSGKYESSRHVHWVFTSASSALRDCAAREGAQRLHLVGGEPGRVVLPDAQRLGYERGVDAVVLDPVEPLEPAHGAHLHRVDHRDRVAPGDEEGVERHPVVPRRLHADEHVAGRLGHAPSQASHRSKPAGAVLEGHPLALLLAAVVHGAYHVVRLGDVHTGVDHLSALLSAAGRRGACPRHPGPQPPRRDPRWRMAPHPANSRKSPGGAGRHPPVRGRVAPQVPCRRPCQHAI